MSFDGIDIPALALIYPSSYHPRAPCAATCASRALRIGYAVGRRHAQICWSMHTAQNGEIPDVQRALPDTQAPAVGTYARFGEGYHWLPPLATTLVGFALFAFKTWSPQNMHFRLVVTDDTHTDTGIAVIVQMPTRVYAPPQPNSFSDTDPLNAFAECEVTLSNVPTGQIVHSYIEGYSSAGAQGPVAPHYAAAFWEAR